MNDITAPAEPSRTADVVQLSEESVAAPAAEKPNELPENIERAPVVEASPVVRVVDADTRDDHLNGPPPKADWLYSENVAGHGEVPEWFNNKTFKTIEDQAKAQNEARKKLGGFTGAPEDGYEVPTESAIADFVMNEDDPLLNKFADMAKELNMSQDGFEQIVNMYIEQNDSSNQETEQEAQKYWEQEMAKLGPNGKEDLKVLKQWSRNALPPEMHDEFDGLISSAAVVKMFQTLIDRTVPTQLTHVAPGTGINRHQLRAMMKNPNYGRDPDYTRHTDAEAEALYGRSKIYD